jgi:ABC-type antimicrobial peptide transport system permease subunit
MSAVNVGNIFMGRGMRMREKFGILMALGASQKEVLRLLSVEALAITLSGTLLSLAFSVPLSRSMLQAMGIEGTSSVFPAFGTLVSWLFILAFSFVPAYQNAMVRPADAMKARWGCL